VSVKQRRADNPVRRCFLPLTGLAVACLRLSALHCLDSRYGGVGGGGLCGLDCREADWILPVTIGPPVPRLSASPPRRVTVT